MVVPLAIVQHTFRDFRKFSRRCKDPKSAQCDSIGVSFPLVIGDAEWIKQDFLSVFIQRFPRGLLNNARNNLRIPVLIIKERARLVIQVKPQHIINAVIRFMLPKNIRLSGVVKCYPGFHSQQVSQGDRSFIRVFGNVFRKIFSNGILNTSDVALIYCNTCNDAIHLFGAGPDGIYLCAVCIILKVTFSNEFTITEYQQALHHPGLVICINIPI